LVVELDVEWAAALVVALAVGLVLESELLVAKSVVGLAVWLDL